VQIRTTKADEQLKTQFETILGRPFHSFVSGESNQVIREKQAQVWAMLEQRKTKLRYEVRNDFELGRVILAMNPADESVNDTIDLIRTMVPPGVDVIKAPIDNRPASYAGVPFSITCTGGYAVRSGGQGGIVTAAHCANDVGSAYGFPLGFATAEVCAGIDRQVHTTPADYLWNGFFNYNGQWTQIYEVAGGYYQGQNVVRVGKFTSAYGQIGNKEPLTIGGTPDCSPGGNYTVSGFKLYNLGGGAVQGGDSGGPMMLVYNGLYFLAGTTSGQQIPGNHQGIVSWRSIPPGWTACTQQTPCGPIR
jgi:hypothetical protein